MCFMLFELKITDVLCLDVIDAPDALHAVEDLYKPEADRL